MIIQTKKDQIFGCFIDDVFRKYLKGYVGSNESFVFTIKPEVKVFYDA
jgi:TLD